MTTKLTTILTNQLIRHRHDNLIKDDAMGKWFTGADLQEDVDTFKLAFIKSNLGHSDQILVCLPNSAVFPVINQAAWDLGIIVHPISPSTPIAKLREDWQQHQYPAMLLAPTLLDNWDTDDWHHTQLPLHTSPHLDFLADPHLTAAPADRTPVADSDLGLILNTSGTTGEPKRVGLTHEMMLNAATNDAISNHMDENDVAMVTMPMFHINAQVMTTLSTRVSDGKVLVTQKFSASHFWQQIYDNGVTWVSVVPTIVSFLLLNEKANAAYNRLKDGIHLRYIRSSSFALAEERLKAFQNRFGAPIIEGYGMTEAASQCTINPFDAPKIGSAGKPFGTELSLMVDGHLTKAPHVMGEIAVRGNHIITHYMDPNPDSFKDGWFLTGDLGYLDEDNYLFVKGRKKEIISHGGEKVAPAAVENTLSELAFIEQISVIGMPDDLYGEEVTAVVVSTTPGQNEDAQRKAIFDYSKIHLARFESPTRVEFLPSFPRNITGKVLRPKLRELLMKKQADKEA
ncbi:AMP-binding protein [Secundilactobacillus folii]|uniref:AMP-binding protein n=1 Tax=Secundilactobacillus folii TaxID=2678357 RepID=A0A7X3C258_9LACO|nr:AMP-binding protein [Secundilactobacillus folii]MTV81226.1 AMP-binding protein [Secundilactobacillus folii]